MNPSDDTHDADVSQRAHDAREAHESHDAHGSHGSFKTYMKVFVALCVLTAMSFFTYTDVWQERFSSHAGWAFMMAVSCTKAMLVILFFMHLKYEANWKYVLTFPAAFVSVFLVCMLVPDVGLRMDNGIYKYSSERWQHAAVPQEDQHHGSPSKSDAGQRHPAGHDSDSDAHE